MTLDFLTLFRLFRTLIIQYAVYLLNGHVYLFHFDVISKHTTELIIQMGQYQEILFCCEI